MNIKAVNTLTGEVFNLKVNPNDPDDLGNTLLNIQGMKKNLEKLETEIKSLADQYMEKGDYNPVQLKNGFQWVYRAPVTKIYSLPIVKRFIDDEDLLVSKGVIKVQTTALKDLVAEMVREGTQPEGMWDELERTAELKASKPYVKLERL